MKGKNIYYLHKYTAIFTTIYLYNRLTMRSNTKQNNHKKNSIDPNPSSDERRQMNSRINYMFGDLINLFLIFITPS